MYPAEVVRRAAEYLERHGVDAPLPTAELLLTSVLRTDRAGIYTRERGLTSAEARHFGRALCSICAGTPVQHLTGEQGFRRLTLSVRAGVFVARPETEVVVEAALEALIGTDEPIVADVGTGAGAIALAIKDERRDARVLATDISAAAIALARENSATLGLEVELFPGDLLSPLPSALRRGLDLVVSNPPYVTAEEYERVPATVRADPASALLGGIDVYERLASQASDWLSPGGYLVVESGETHASQVSEVAAGAGFVDVRVLADLAGRDRVVTARLR